MRAQKRIRRICWRKIPWWISNRKALLLVQRANVLQITGRGAWDCYEGVSLYACTVLVHPQTFTVGLCHRADTVLDGPLVWLCMVIVMFLVYPQNSYAWRWEKIILSKSIYLFVWLISSLKQMEGKKMLMEIQTGSTLQTKQHRLVPAELLLFMLHGTWKRPLLSAARAQMQKDNEMIWVFFLLLIMVDLMFIIWMLRHTWAVAAQCWVRITTENNPPWLIHSDEIQASTQGKLYGFSALTDFSLQYHSMVTLTV